MGAFKKAVPVVATAAATYYGGPSAGAAVYSSFQASATQAENIKVKARAEQTSSKNREIERKRNLLRALALQNVRTGMSGLTAGIGSSAQAVTNEDISNERFDSLLDTSATSQRVSQLQQNAKNISTYSLLSAAGEAYGSYSRKKKRGEV